MSDEASKLLGVLGHPIEHSQSPSLFKRILAAEGRDEIVYRTFDLPDIEDFHTLTQDHPNLVGLNVTVPHKQAILSKLVRVSEEAQAVGAVNTLVKTPRGWEGHNTDVWGFQRSIQPFLANRHERALVLGTGAVQLQCITSSPSWALTQSASPGMGTAHAAHAPSEGHPLGTTKCRNGSCATTSWWSIAPLWACIPKTKTWCRFPPCG